MAIQADYTYRNLPVTGAYVRVHRVFGGKLEGWNSVVRVYANATVAAEDANQFLDEFNHSAAYDADNQNAIELVYNSLMTSDKFTNSEAV